MNSASATDRPLTLAPAGTASPAEAGPASARPRLDSLDFVRGLIMIVMALDHARDFMGAGDFNPRDVHNTALFLTRWVTHFCAPTFVFLAGISAYLYGSRGRSRSQLSSFLLTRGLWLILMELILVRFAWAFTLSPHVHVLQVIWVIGISLCCLSALVYLPRPAVLALALTMILGHNLLDRFSSERLGSLRWLWMILHERGIGEVAGITLMIIYPLLPWIGVLAAGYSLGPIIQAETSVRQRRLVALGGSLICLFLMLRLTNLYGDPQTWSAQSTRTATVLSVLNCEKYPPSLLYLCMTLGPMLVLLAKAERLKGSVTSFITTFGRVPFLFYVAHVALLHLMAVVWAQLHDGNSAWLFDVRPIMGKPATYGLSLPMIYLAWLVAIAILYPLCLWFAKVKQRRRDWWLSYL